MTLLRAEGVADRSADAEDVIGVELEIVGNVVVMCFRTHEESLPDVIAHSYTGMHQEMRVVDIGGAAAGVGAVGLSVEEESFAAGSGHEISANFRSHPARIHCVDVVESWAEVLGSVVEALLRPECTFNIDAQPLFCEVLQAAAGEDSTFFRGRKKGLRCGEGLGRPKCAATDGEINLLGTSNGDEGCEDASEESSSQLPVLSSQQKSHPGSQPAPRGF